MKERAGTGAKSGERSAACATCGKTFARSDTLLRHEKNHQSTENRGPVHRVTNGTFRACQGCASARSRCSGGTPCGRCGVRKLECVYPNKRRKGSSINVPGVSDDGGSKQQLLGQFSNLVFTVNDQTRFVPDGQASTRKSSAPRANPAPVDGYQQPAISSDYDSQHEVVSHAGQLSFEVNPANPAAGPLGNENHFGDTPMTSQFSSDFPGAPTSTFNYEAFDEPLNWIPLSIYPSPYDAELEQDFSFILPPLSDTPNFAEDYSMVPVDHAPPMYQVPSTLSQDRSDNQGFPAPRVPLEQSPASSASDGLSIARTNNTTSTAPDFRRKKRKLSAVPDMFHRPRLQGIRYAFPESLDARHALPSTDGNDNYCSQAMYEAVLERFRSLCVGDTWLQPFENPAFPDIRTLNTCIHLYFEQFHPNFPLIHKASFAAEADWISVLATATIGSTFIKTLWAPELREAFQEFLRRAVQQSADGTSAVDCDIHLAQARILNLVGLAQSDRDRLRGLAPRYHADLSRWCLDSGVLQLPDSENFSVSELDGENKDAKWHVWQKWIRIESLRRIAYMTWLMDCCLGYMSNARPLCNMDDARTPLPCAESAWEASSPESWASAVGQTFKTPSLCVALEALYNNKKVDQNYSDLSQVLLIHALYQRTWEVGTHIKQPLSEWVPTGKARGFLNTPSKDNFWLPLYPLYANWRNSACDCLDVLYWQASSVVAKASGVEHGVILHLHLARIILLTPFQEIQDLLFSLIGKVGNSSQASFYVHDGSYQPRNSEKLPQIRKITWRWLREDQHKARLAMVHAGSVFWYVRRYSTTSMHEPVAVYLASLVLWTYGSYKSAALERDASAANQKPEGGPSGPDAGAAIQPSRMERKEHPVEFIKNVASHPGNDFGPVKPQHPTTITSPRETIPSNGDTMSDTRPGAEAQMSPPSPLRNPDSDSDEEPSSADEQPEFIHLDRPCDDEMVQHFVRNGHNMSGHMSNVGDICKSPQKVLLEGAKLLRTRLSSWGISREYYDILTKLAELRKAG